MEIKEINGKSYGVAKLPATKGLSLQLKLGKFLGGGLNELRGLDTSSAESILSSLGGIITNIDDEDFSKFVKETVCHAKKMILVEGQDEATPTAFNFDKEFEDDYMAMWELFIFVLEVNLGGFLAAVKSRFANNTATTKAKIKPKRKN